MKWRDIRVGDNVRVTSGAFWNNFAEVVNITDEKHITVKMHGVDATFILTDDQMILSGKPGCPICGGYGWTVHTLHEMETEPCSYCFPDWDAQLEEWIK